MRLNELILENFGPYLGRQVLRFGGERPVVLVHGDNMRGKTSLFNAVKWVLYGAAPDRLGKALPRCSLVNQEAADGGVWTMSVELTFKVADTKYELRRSIQPRVAGGVPKSDADFQEILHLRRDGALLPADQAQTEVNRILPREISSFFLFDGEMLSRYELLLSEVDKDAQLIKTSIEDILGVPVLANAVVDLRLGLRDAARRQKDAAHHDAAAQVFTTEATRLEHAISASESDLERLRAQMARWEEEKVQLEDQLQSMARTEAELARLHDIEGQMARNSSTEASLFDQRRIELAVAWRDMVQPRLRTRIEELEQQRDRELGHIEEAGALRARLHDLQQLTLGGHCSVCGQTVTDNAHTIQEVERTKAKLAEVPADHATLARLGSAVHRLSKITPAGALRNLRSIEAQLRRILVEQVDLELKRDEVAARLGRDDKAVVGRVRLTYDQIVKTLRDLENTIGETEASIADKQLKAAENRARIRRVSGPAMGRLNREVEIYEQLISVFERSIDVLRDRLRQKVESDASEIFRELTTDKSYQGLRINGSYGLAIVDGHGKEVTVRSAGAEQVVALALVGALNRNAVRRGPVIMDTPFGRLDPLHRENILKFVPKLADQVTLLVHGGEVDRSRDLAHLAASIDRQYEIAYRNSRHSELLPLKEGDE